MEILYQGSARVPIGYHDDKNRRPYCVASVLHSIVTQLEIRLALVPNYHFIYRVNRG